MLLLSIEGPNFRTLYVEASPQSPTPVLDRESEECEPQHHVEDESHKANTAGAITADRVSPTPQPELFDRESLADVS
ncbi:hypothetical protein RRF57_007587 [Xylaria bambusicola]|uniref:Uncharacterized protein n=1 Tax=Xylaria bambusicola TaxID=326684 RepID=A0AAN7ULD1_9PEZI